MRNGTHSAVGETAYSVKGLGTAMSRMKKAVGTLEDLQPALQKISQYGGKQLKARTPVRSGNLKGTVKTRKRARKATVSIGTKRFYYGPFVNYGNL